MVLVVVVVVSVVMVTCGVGRDSFAFEEAAGSSWAYLLNSRSILRSIASDYSASATFLSVLHITLLSFFSVIVLCGLHSLW